MKRHNLSADAALAFAETLGAGGAATSAEQPKDGKIRVIVEVDPRKGLKLTPENVAKEVAEELGSLAAEKKTRGRILGLDGKVLVEV